MTQPSSGAAPLPEDEVTLLAVGTVVLRWRRTIITLAVSGGLLGLASGLLSRRVFSSSATFIPQGSEAVSSGLALAASQLGFRVPTTGAAWGPPVYVELLHSQAVLEPIASDTVAVEEEGGRRASFMDLLRIKAPTPARRADLAVRALRRIVDVSEDKKLSAVRVSVATAWPSVSLALAQRLVEGVTKFNLESRRSQARAERVFVDAQAQEAETALRQAEDRLQVFLQRNREFGAAELAFQKDRMQRDVSLLQQVYVSLLQAREEARIREVRDTPVITMLEEPRLPLMGEARHSVQRGLLGGIVGGMLGIALALLASRLAAVRRAPSDGAREFFALLGEVVPSFKRRRP